MNWFAIGGGAALVIVAFTQWRAGKFALPVAATLGIAGLVFIALGADLV